MPAEDPYLWLEDVGGDDALAWVREHNARTTAALASSEGFETLRGQIKAALDSDARIPFVRRRGGFLYNYWQDAANPRGLWRRTTLESYRTEAPEWHVLLDVDALGAAEGENWVWKGAAVLRPDHRRALVELSRGGADAVVVREFDLEAREFVPDGFELPEAKGAVGWLDADRIYVGTDFGPGSLTSSGYPRVVKEWRRGTPLEQAATVYSGKVDDVWIRAFHDPTEGFERSLVRRGVTFYTAENFHRAADGELVRIEVPDDAEVDSHREWLLVTLRTAWTVGGTTHPAGALLVTRFDDFLAGGRDLTPLFTPDAHTSLSGHAWTRNHLIITTLHDVRTRMEVLTPGPDGWTRAPLAGVREFETADVVGTDPDEGDEYMIASGGFTEPTELRLGHVGGDVEVLKRAPAFFDAEGMVVEQHFATSDDGTRIPYFVVTPPGAEGGPTLLYAYGGFEVSLTPAYNTVAGLGWLSRGGTYVVANLRGGGEYGPEWHQSALRENRPRVYEDCAAVARDLVARGITTPERLGIRGGSNGGLLVGVMLTRYPELFGAIVCQVPLLDMKRYHLLLAGASWMAEYGDPDEPGDWEFLAEYSPYQNVRAGQPYPPTLFTTSTRDDRVHPGHARKMVARLRELGYDVPYHENIEGGHGGAADSEQSAFMWALAYTFLWNHLTK
ncbi:prolyl oligopeptidase family serine peptidase [Umezawaea sp. Da 62-37]|uniref:prolyl oligopeptidase family serine peptidase n=1 Tax=Umezawaea sp. Da 62-37 TaxID=3075927 RepID=UPI0028F6FCA1|nr:prolyl oligopeptidase family serine peptidase [Umezawaea sp. Da 62-37]WNV92080.1 prolyl oligopeptidase family serine peptidase [Umezawaea sp. Da 62-37]